METASIVLAALSRNLLMRGEKTWVIRAGGKVVVRENEIFRMRGRVVC